MTRMAPFGWLQWFRDKFLVPWWSRYVVIPVIEAAPAAFATLWFGLGHKLLKGYTPPWIFFGTAAWGGGVAAARSALSEFAAFSVTRLVEERNDLLRLIGYVQVIVGVKSARFTDTSIKLTDPIDPATAFFTITQPEVQIREIVRAIFDFFSARIQPGEAIKVSLMEWNTQGGHLDFIEHFPDADRPRALPQVFRDASTIAGQAYYHTDLVVSEDVQNDRNFQLLGTHEEGSMFSYPVYDDQSRSVALVVNVVSNRVRRFRKRDREALKIPMSAFGQRLLLEYRLRTLKRRAERQREVG